jgi:hypothetical protein
MGVVLVAYMQLYGAVVVLPSTKRTNWCYSMTLPKVGNMELSAVKDVK